MMQRLSTLTITLDGLLYIQLTAHQERVISRDAGIRNNDVNETSGRLGRGQLERRLLLCPRANITFGEVDTA